jgi:hypothetical protein
LAVGWLEYVKTVATGLGLRVHDLTVYLVLPDIACGVYLSLRTGMPIVYCEDTERLADFTCYYNRRIRRYVCRAVPVLPQAEPERGVYEWQAVLSVIFKACYPEGERRDYGRSILNNLHWECFKTYEFTTRDINRHVRHFGRGLRSIRGVLDFLKQVAVQAELCCLTDCLHSWNFPNEQYIMALAEVNFEYYSSERKEDVCYIDRCPEMFPGRERYVEEEYTEEQVFICEIEIKSPRERRRERRR